MRDTFSLFGKRPPQPGRAGLARLVGMSAGHQLDPPADLPTEVSWLANGTLPASY